ncbi:hypothetical protein K435DRAFT_861624 [Dendrothele bispora CBS 962.96]|uniref:HTH La-type RNA-binding domain-containing protein n=1 Tax=Dendrothele bispora (strain CBS 962.96) TaxID=1314807 RepID=A0A4S8LW65_DENBC|nr:hypothetical protein K435DRAFT_861624 [Dendrothele bispora CBS 962.96]
MTTTTSAPVNVWQLRAAARANGAKSDSSSSTVASSSASSSTATSISTLPLTDDTDSVVVKKAPRNRPPPPLDDPNLWPQVGERPTQNEPKKPIADSPRKSEKKRSKWGAIPSQGHQAAADTAAKARQPSSPPQLSNNSSGFNSSSQSQSQSRSHSRAQSQSANTNGTVKEKEKQTTTTDENAGPDHTSASQSGSVVSHTDNNSTAVPQSGQSSIHRSLPPSTHHSHPHQHHPPPPPRFSGISHHPQPLPHHQVPGVYPPYMHTSSQFADPTSSGTNNMNGVNGMGGYYPHPQPHNASPHLPGPPLPLPSLHHSHSHSSSMSIPYSYPMYYENGAYDYAAGMYTSPGQSIPGSGAASGVNSGYQTPFYGAGYTTLRKLMFGTIEGDTEISRDVNKRGSASEKLWAIGDGVRKKSSKRKSRGKRMERTSENVDPKSLGKGKGRAVETVIDLTEGQGVGMSEIVKKGVETGERGEDGKKDRKKWVFGTTNLPPTGLPAFSEPFMRPTHLHTHLQQLPPLTVPVLSPIPPLPSILPTPMSSVPMPIQPLQSTYPPPQHSYYENSSFDDMSWMRQQHQQYPQPPSMGIFGGQVPSGAQIPQINGEQHPGPAMFQGQSEDAETRNQEAREGATGKETSDSKTGGSEDVQEPVSGLSQEEEKLAVPASATTDTSDRDDLSVRDFGYGFGRASGTGYAAQDAREGIAAREKERLREQEGRPYRGGGAGDRSPGHNSPRFGTRNLPDGPPLPGRGRRGRGRGYRGDRGGRGWYGRGGYHNHNNGNGYSSGRGHYGGGPYSPNNPYNPHHPNGSYSQYGQWAPQPQPGQFGQFGQYAQPPDPALALTPPPAFQPLPLPGEGDGAYYPTNYAGQPQPPFPQSLMNGQHSPSSSPQVPQEDATMSRVSPSQLESKGPEPGESRNTHRTPLQTNPHAPPVPTPITLLPYSLDPTRYWLLGQLEYYLSPQNMAQDLFLRKKASNFYHSQL